MSGGIASLRREWDEGSRLGARLVEFAGANWPCLMTVEG